MRRITVLFMLLIILLTTACSANKQKNALEPIEKEEIEESYAEVNANINNQKEEDKINVNVNGKVLNLNTYPMDINDIIMLPLIDIFEALELDVSWNPITREMNTEGNNVHLTINMEYKQIRGNINGVRHTIFFDQMDAPPIMMNGTMLIPASFLAETIGAKVDWDNSTRTVIIKTNTDSVIYENFLQLIDYNPKPSDLISYLEENIDKVYSEIFTQMVVDFMTYTELECDSIYFELINEAFSEFNQEYEYRYYSSFLDIGSLDRYDNIEYKELRQTLGFIKSNGCKVYATEIGVESSIIYIVKIDYKYIISKFGKNLSKELIDELELKIYALSKGQYWD